MLTIGQLHPYFDNFVYVFLNFSKERKVFVSKNRSTIKKHFGRCLRRDKHILVKNSSILSIEVRDNTNLYLRKLFHLSLEPSLVKSVTKFANSILSLFTVTIEKVGRSLRQVKLVNKNSKLDASLTERLFDPMGQCQVSHRSVHRKLCYYIAKSYDIDISRKTDFVKRMRFIETLES